MRIGTHPWYSVTTLPTDPGRSTTAADAGRRWADAVVVGHSSCRGVAVHSATDGLRVVVVAAWDDRPDPPRLDGARTDHLTVVHCSREDGVPVDTAGGVATVIDVLPVPRLLLGAAARFTVRNGRAFARAPGFGAAVVLRSSGRRGAITTYAHWHDEGAFLRAFTAQGGTAVATTAQVNAAAARRTRGLIRTDYHTHDVIHVAGR